MSDTANELIVTLGDYLIESKTEEAVSLIKEERFQDCLKNQSWDLIPLISKYFSEEILNERPIVFHCCEILINELATRAYPEEALLEFLEQAECAEDIRFTAMLKPIQTSLLKMPSRVEKSIEWCLNTIHKHINSLPLPQDMHLEGKERKLMDCDPCVQRINTTYAEVITFYKPFIEEVVTEKSNVINRMKLRETLLQSCILLLGKPMTVIDLETDGKMMSASRLNVEKIMQCIADLADHFMMFLEMLDLRNSNPKQIQMKPLEEEGVMSDIDMIPDLSIATFYYLLFAEYLQLDLIPNVYSPIFIFQNSLYLSVVLMKEENSISQRKGLRLATAVVNRVSNRSMPEHLLESKTHPDFFKFLAAIMTHSDVEDNRKLAVELLTSYIFKFDFKGRFLLLTNQHKVHHHSGLLGYITTLLKNVIIESLDINPNGNHYFSGKQLFGLLDQFCHLKDGATTDLWETADEIVSSLNLVRFLALRDEANVTGFWLYAPRLRARFLEPLREGIILSRAHYNLKINDLREGRNLSEHTEMEVIVGGQVLAAMSVEQQISRIQSALTCFDLLDSLLNRVSELLELYPKTLKT